MAAAFDGLPEELMTLILLKLPVKSLLQLKCVQKSWYSLIKSPQFVHLHRSSSSNNCFVVRRLTYLSISSYSHETLPDLGHEINVPISSNFLTLCGSCDGLVCITNLEDQLFICNPTIGELRSLFVPPSLDDGSGYHIDSIAFGSDPNTGQYNLVMVGMPYRFDFYDAFFYSDREVHLYDFSTDTWRETAVLFPAGPFLYSCDAVSFNGAFHWCPWDHCGSNILTFQISNEVTELIPLPDFVDVSHEKELCVSSKSHLLSLILFDKRGRFEIWVMTEYGVKESWTRLFKIGPLPEFLHPIAFWDEQRLLLKNPELGQLVSCDLQHQNLRHIPIGGDFGLYPYSPSLVSVNGIGHPNYFE